MKLSIGITEGSDPAFHPEWERNATSVNGCVTVSKNLNANVRDAIIRTDAKLNGAVIVHCTCTGFGHTPLEPNVPSPDEQGDNLFRLITSGFPSERCVWRIDPVIPTADGIARAKLSFGILDGLNHNLAARGISPVTRIRVSVLDNYRHVKERFRQAGLDPLYNGEWNAGYADQQTLASALRDMAAVPDIPYIIETCAERTLAKLLSECGAPYEPGGCISERDLRLMGFSNGDISDTITLGINGQNRSGCSCVACKRELIPARGRCPGKCLYCYWRDK